MSEFEPLLIILLAALLAGCTPEFQEPPKKTFLKVEQDGERRMEWYYTGSISWTSPDVVIISHRDGTTIDTALVAVNITDVTFDQDTLTVTTFGLPKKRSSAAEPDMDIEGVVLRIDTTGSRRLGDEPRFSFQIHEGGFR